MRDKGAYQGQVKVRKYCNLWRLNILASAESTLYKSVPSIFSLSYLTEVFVSPKKMFLHGISNQLPC